MEIEQKVDNIEQKPHISFDKQEKEKVSENNKSYLITISDVETQINLGVIAPNIMIAIQKFSQKYQNDFNELILLSIDIQEIEIIE